MRGWASDACSVRFQPMNLFAIEEENLHLPDGQVYMLRSYWIEPLFFTKSGQDKDPFSSAPLSFPLTTFCCCYIYIYMYC